MAISCTNTGEPTELWGEICKTTVVHVALVKPTGSQNKTETHSYGEGLLGEKGLIIGGGEGEGKG